MLGRGIGLSKDKVDHLRHWRESTVYTDIERLVLEYTERLATEVRIEDELYDRLREHFTPRQILVLCTTVGVAGMINRIHGTFKTELEEFTSSRPKVQESLDKLLEK
ncbi:carboxymuconolactone decarboxylase family protein [Neobacillus sp. SAB-20_R2A]|uniref:carboxymuconolactone decarboxylase family protein n=1 Tax=Neobacillus sp. SAB-20_R2A TaxID=3120519 RepID=UPI003C6E6200